MRYFPIWEILLVLCVIGWILYYRHGVRLMEEYQALTDELSELFDRYDLIVEGKELNRPKELITDRFWIYYDPNHLERFFFSLECAIFEVNKTYDLLTSYCCYLGNRRWEEIKSLYSKNRLLLARVRYMKWENGFGNTTSK